MTGDNGAAADLMALTIAAEKDEPEVHLSDPFPVPACSACFDSAATGVVG